MQNSTTSPLSNDKKKSSWGLFKSSSSSSLSSLSSKFSVATASILLFFLFLCTLVLTRWSDIVYGDLQLHLYYVLEYKTGLGSRFALEVWMTLQSTLAGNSIPYTISMFSKPYKAYPKRDQYLLTCTSSNMTLTCPSNYPPTTNLDSFSNKETCPEYFKWIHEDLSTWKEQGITKELVDSLQDTAHFRLTIVNGTAYVKHYQNAFQTRDVYTLWGILQLLKLYPGRLPDLDLMFQCHDPALIKKRKYKRGGAPPQFHYCGDDSTLDIVFPDWSFWGWPEISIKPWVPFAKDLKDGNKIKEWSARENFAFWRGNLNTGHRKRLRHCNSIDKWGTQLVQQNWGKEMRDGFKNSDLTKQCLHRYKLYMEGNSWSVSEKYILACDAMTLIVNPVYYDFFTRSLIPMKHYWPVNTNNVCKSIKFAVDWGNNNTAKAQKIGKEGSEYIFNKLKMEHVYDYMFHVLNEYGKLFKYKPTVPEGAEELCSERFACSPPGLETKYKAEATVTGPSDRGPCVLPSPYDRDTLQSIRDRNAKIKEVVEMWERGSG